VFKNTLWRKKVSDFSSKAGISGLVVVELVGQDGKIKSHQEFKNLITEVGDRYYGERAAGVAGAPAIATGMQLGTGTTAPAKSGAGAAIVTLVASSLVVLNPSIPVSSLSAGSRRLAYSCSWAAGVATATIAEIALVNQAIATQTIVPAANTISRALISVTKGATDVLNVTWYHDLLGG
jgi:hypothetical protein